MLMFTVLSSGLTCLLNWELLLIAMHISAGGQIFPSNLQLKQLFSEVAPLLQLFKVDSVLVNSPT